MNAKQKNVPLKLNEMANKIANNQNVPFEVVIEFLKLKGIESKSDLRERFLSVTNKK